MAVGPGSVLERPHWGFSALGREQNAPLSESGGPPRTPSPEEAGVLFWGSGLQGSPAHFREASAVEEVVTSHTPALGPSLTQTAPEPLPEPFIPLCQAVLSTWASSQSHLWATLPSENDCGESYC